MTESERKEEVFTEKLKQLTDDGYTEMFSFIPIGPNLNHTAQVKVMVHEGRRKLAFVGKHRNYSRYLSWSKEDLEVANALLADVGYDHRLVVLGKRMHAKEIKCSLPVRKEPVPCGTLFYPLGKPRRVMKCVRTADGVVFYKRRLTKVDEKTLDKHLRGVTLEAPLGLFDVMFRLK